MKKLFLRKRLKANFVEVDEEHHGLGRHLGWFQLIVIGIGAIIGAGIFVITGNAAAEYSGPAIVLSFILAAIICAFAGLCYAELSSLIPVSGGAYSYAYVALGELPAWIIGWSITGQFILSASTVAAGWSGYFKSFLADWHITIPKIFASPPLSYDTVEGWSLSGSLIDLPAALLVFFIGIMISLGTRAVSRLNSVMVVIKLATILIFVILGIPHINPENWTPFIPENTGNFGDFGWTGIIRAAGLLFFAYLGFDTVSTLAQDAKNPQRDLPRGILGSLLISTIAYIIIAGVLTGIVSYKMLNVPDPIAVALNAMGPSFFWIGAVVKFAILAALASVILVQLLGQTRIFMAIGNDGLLPKKVAKINPKTKTPVTASIITAAACMLMSSIFPVVILGQLVSIFTLVIFAIVCAGVWILRHTHPEFKRAFKVPLVPLIPLLGILACVSQMLFFPLVTWMQLALFMIIGLIIYFSYGIKWSKIRLQHTAAPE